MKIEFPIKGTCGCLFLRDDGDKVGPECNVKYHIRFAKGVGDVSCVGITSESCPLNEYDEIAVRRSQ